MERKQGADTKIIAYFEWYCKGFQTHPFPFVGKIPKKLSHMEENTQLVHTDIQEVDEDKEIDEEGVSESETETAIKNLRSKLESIKTTVDKMVEGEGI